MLSAAIHGLLYEGIHLRGIYDGLRFGLLRCMPARQGVLQPAA